MVSCMEGVVSPVADLELDIKHILPRNTSIGQAHESETSTAFSNNERLFRDSSEYLFPRNSTNQLDMILVKCIQRELYSAL